jgi:hypothetical protein
MSVAGCCEKGAGYDSVSRLSGLTPPTFIAMNREGILPCKDMCSACSACEVDMQTPPSGLPKTLN